jgi:KDO2-lipid IV(A) lauroyltransferase
MAITVDRTRAETGLGRVLVSVLARGTGALPRGTAARLGRLVGDCRRATCPRDVEAVRENLRRLSLTRADGPGARDAEDRLVRETFRAFGLFAIEFFRGLRASPPAIVRDWAIEGWSHAEALAADPRGFIVASAHTGNWEQLAALAHPLGRRIVAPAATQFHPWLSPAIGRAKQRWQIDSVPPDRELRGLLRALALGRLVALPLDGGSYRRGVPVRLRGRRVRLPAGAARLAVLSGRPILPVFARRTEAMRHAVRLSAPIWPSLPPEGRDATEIRAITQRLADLLGEHLERTPGQWCIFRALDWEDAPAPRPASRPALAAVSGSR